MVNDACTRGVSILIRNAASKGNTIIGHTFKAIVANSSKKLNCESGDTKANIAGAHNATLRLLSTENDATRPMLPPSMPVTTGAAVATGHKTHTRAERASVGLIKFNGRNTMIEPNICIASSCHISLWNFKSRGSMRQKVKNSITKMRYGTVHATISM